MLQDFSNVTDHSGMLYIKLLKYNCYLLEFSAKKNS